jgi:hypothetical protein
MEQQIADLITVLTNPDWIDFTSPKNQVVAKYFDSPDASRKQLFFHQLLLSVELYLRIHSRDHTEKAKRKLLKQLPPSIAWDLAVAQRWLENMSISKPRTSSKQSTFSFDLRSKKRQKDALRTFALTLKWPNMDELDYVLDEKDREEKTLEDRSADTMSWFTGVILPGVTLPWLLMNTLIDCDRDTGEPLKYLTHIHPESGFQYRANTYWSYRCIVGKVLGAARGVSEIAGWIGPCIFTPDLKRTECVRVRQATPPEPRLTTHDVSSMGLRTNPLGPVDESYPIDDYEIPMPDTEDVTDLIRMEKLGFQPIKNQPSSARYGDGAPLVFDAAIVFACGGQSWPMRLRYDVDFVAAFPCHEGPHGKLDFLVPFFPASTWRCLVYWQGPRGMKDGRNAKRPNSPLLRLRLPRHKSRRRPRRHPRLGRPVRPPTHLLPVLPSRLLPRFSIPAQIPLPQQLFLLPPQFLLPLSLALLGPRHFQKPLINRPRAHAGQESAGHRSPWG